MQHGCDSPSAGPKGAISLGTQRSGRRCTTARALQSNGGMKRKQHRRPRKLTLDRETVRALADMETPLADAETARVAGGFVTGPNTCMSCIPC